MCSKFLHSHTVSCMFDHLRADIQPHLTVYNHNNTDKGRSCPLTCCSDAIKSNKSVETCCSSGQRSTNAIGEKSTHSIHTGHIGSRAQVSAVGREHYFVVICREITRRTILLYLCKTGSCVHPNTNRIILLVDIT